MTINGIIRSLTVAHNRGVRQAAYEQKLARKRADLGQAAAEVEDYNDLIEFLTGSVETAESPSIGCKS